MTRTLSRRGFLRCVACGATATVLAACAPQGGNADPQPPEIAYGQDVCANCGMVISEPRFACASLLVDGAYRKCDDIGDLAVYHMDHPNEQVAAYFVHDYHSEQWIRGESATFVHSRTITSPMGHGLAAFSSREAAEGFAKSECGDSDCQVLSFDEMRAHVHMNVHG